MEDWTNQTQEQAVPRDVSCGAQLSVTVVVAGEPGETGRCPEEKDDWVENPE